MSLVALPWSFAARASQCRSLRLTDRISILPASLRQLANAQHGTVSPNQKRTASTTPTLPHSKASSPNRPPRTPTPTPGPRRNVRPLGKHNRSYIQFSVLPSSLSELRRAETERRHSFGSRRTQTKPPRKKGHKMGCAPNQQSSGVRGPVWRCGAPSPTLETSPSFHSG